MGDDKFNDKIKIKQHYKERIEQLREELKQDFNFVWIIWQKNNYILPYPTIVIDKPVKNVLVDSYLNEEFLFYQKNQQTLNTEEKTTLYYYVIIPYPQWKFTKPFFKDENDDYLEVNDFYLENTNEKIWNVVKLTDWTEKIFYNLQSFNKSNNKESEENENSEENETTNTEIEKVKETNKINFWLNVWWQKNIIKSAEEYKHFAIIWWTWSWKSIRVKSLLEQFFQQNVESFLIDKNSSDYYDVFSNYYDKVKLYSWIDYVKSYQSILNLLLIIKLYFEVKKLEMVNEKVSSFEDYLKINPNAKRLLLIFDEFQTMRNNISELWKNYVEKFDSLFQEILTTGRSYWVSLIVSTQNLNSEIFPASAKSNLNFLIWKLDNPKDFSTSLNTKFNEAEIIQKNNSFLFYDKWQETFLSNHLVELETKPVDKEIEKQKQSSILAMQNVIQEALNKNIETKFLDEEILTFFNFSFDEINNLKNSEYYVIVLYFLGKLKKKLHNIIDTMSQFKTNNIIEFSKIPAKNLNNNIIDESIEDYFFEFSFSEKKSTFYQLFQWAYNVIKSNYEKQIKNTLDEEDWDNFSELLNNLEDDYKNYIKQQLCTELWLN